MFFQPSRDETNREDVERIVPSYADEAGFNDATPKVSFANSAHRTLGLFLALSLPTPFNFELRNEFDSEV